MTTNLLLMRGPGGTLIPVTDEGAALIQKWPQGQGVWATVRRARNLAFHRKLFAMLQLAIEHWDPKPDEDGVYPVKNFDRFRRDMLILAGFYNTVASFNGLVIQEAHSISFSSMGEDEFAEVYNKVGEVILSKVLREYTKADLDRVVEQMIRFF